ncbi:hypothetical protein FIBSPDRAFT_753367 [Athelia psychrophila]|uniref:Zn(2)-C6 fungal-type domain-containing protein n=1 Tax=Athelia psychrophila TaxID=1759441 RepID=A0A166CC26_9AGAM|nr:hypothetical protein FIBSPDRAFT_753367 [Fibularhizoctonia sp. CBS 109695]
MKRGFTIGSTTDGPSNSRPPNIRQKRSKTNQACSACKKSKTRCEVLESESSDGNRCHRCTVLAISCSFGEAIHDAPQHAPPSNSTSPASTSASTSPPASSSIPANILTQLLNVTEVSDHPINLEPLPLPVPPSLRRSGTVDWIDTPVYAIRTLSRIEYNPSGARNDPMVHVDNVLRDILSAQQLDSLLQTFEEKFSPWLNLPPGDPHQGSAFLRLAKCLVASRLLDAPTRASIVPRMQELTEKTVGRVLFNPAPAADSIQAMVVLALWATVGAGLGVAPRDERLMIAAGVSMAINLRLNDSVAHLLRIEADEVDDRPAAVDLEELRNKARLWLCLTNVESMLCMGTGRLPLSIRKASDHDAIDWSSSATIESGRDARLALSGQIYATTEAGLRVRFEKLADLDFFYLKVLEMFGEFDNLENFLAPLSAVTEHENFQVFVMQMEWRMCRLLFTNHCLGEIGKAYGGGQSLPRGWYCEVVSNGICLPETWGKQSLLLAQGILTSAISQFKNLTEASAVPDSIFAMLCSTAAFLVRIKISAHSARGVRIPGSSDMLLQRTRELLMTATCGPDHIPAQCARIIVSLVDTYEAHIRVPLPQEQDTDSAKSMWQRDFSRPVESLPSPGNTGIDQSQESGGLPGDDELGAGMSLGLSPSMYEATDLDSDFWASFMNNLAADGQM